jgi:hypothetical protein
MSVTEKSKYNAMEIANLFYESGYFQYAGPDLMVDDYINCASDTYFSQQWGLNNTGQNGGTSGIDIKACNAWQISTGSNITVAVLDQGIDLTHPDLATNIHALSFDSESGTSPQQVLDNHGTACAGIVGAVKNNAKGIAGVAPNCKLMAISNSLVGTPLSRMKRADGINWAWQNGADVISNSWSSSVQYPVIDDAINNAVTQGRNGKGCVVVFASGNDYSSPISYPASLSNVIAVGAIDNTGQRASFSNYGTALDVVAPGVDLYTTDIQGSAGYVTGNYYSSFSGTSAACPHVAGVAALILSIRPDLTQVQVRQLIESTCQKVSGYTYTNNASHPNGTWNNQVGHGLVNAYAAVNTALAMWTPEIDLTNSNLNPGPLGRGARQTFSAQLKRAFPIHGATYHWNFDFSDTNPNITNEVCWDTDVPYVSSNMWPCGVHYFTVTVTAGIYGGIAWADFYGTCTGNMLVYSSPIKPVISSINSYSAAYPNPAGNELIIDRIEEGNSTETAINTQSARRKASEITVLLYSHSTAKMVYEKTYSSADKQIRIDTSKLQGGVYYLNIIENGEKVKEQTIIVNH